MSQAHPGDRNRDRVHTVSFYAAIVLLTYLLWVVVRPFVLPLCASAVLVVFFYPWHQRLERRLSRGSAALASTLIATILLLVPMLLVLVAFVREAASAAGSVQDALSAARIERLAPAWSWLQQRVPPLAAVQLSDVLADAGRTLAGVAASTAGDALRNLGVILFDIVVMIFAMFFLFRDAPAVMGLVRRVLPFEEEPREAVISQARDLIRASVVSSIVVASAQGAAGGVLFWAVGLTAPIFWGVVMAFFALLPVGAWIVWLPAAVWLLLTGQTARGIVTLAVGAGAVSLIDNVLRPALLAGRAQMNGLLVLVSLLGGLGAFGLIGIVIGPVVVATMTSLLAAYTGPRQHGRRGHVAVTQPGVNSSVESRS
jgi:predicted PurR-regulated permease PerM